MPRKIFSEDGFVESRSRARSRARSRRRRIAAAVLVLALAIGVGAAVWYVSLSGPEDAAAAPAMDDLPFLESLIGRERPDFSLPDRAGQMRTASEWDGQVLVVNFWATWCIPCRNEIPLLADLHTRHDGLTVVGIALDEPGAVETFLAEFGAAVDFPVLVAPGDAGIDTAIAWGNPIGGLPYTVIVAPDRRIAFAQFGELTHEQAARAVAPFVR